MTRLPELDPTTVLLAIATVGILIGSVRIRRVGLSLAGVLCAALLCGTAFPDLSENYGELLSFCTKLGLSLFVSCIAVQAGQAFRYLTRRKAIKAFFSGMVIVSCGGIPILLCSRLCRASADLSAGVFAGSLTSTPALAEATELFGAAPAIGYAVSYCFGLLLIVLFVQIMRGESVIETKTQTFETKKAVDPFPVVLIAALVGNVLSRFTFVSTTTGILIVGILCGVLFGAFKRALPDLNQIRSLGLILFFIGTGLSAGGTLKETVRWEWFCLGLSASLGAVGIGYVCLRFLFRYDRADALAVLCGGMTSTPAISVLRPAPERLPLYTVSYTGALCALLVWVRIFYFIAERGW